MFRFPPLALIFSLSGALIHLSVGVAPVVTVALLQYGDYHEFNKSELQHPSDLLKFVTFLVAVGLPTLSATLGFFSMSLYKIRGSKLDCKE